MRVGGQHHASAALLLGITRYLLYRSLGGLQGRSRWMRWKSSSTGIRSLDRLSRSKSLHWLRYPGLQKILKSFSVPKRDHRWRSHELNWTPIQWVSYVDLSYRSDKLSIQKRGISRWSVSLLCEQIEDDAVIWSCRDSFSINNQLINNLSA